MPAEESASASRTSFSFSSAICSLVTSSSASGSVSRLQLEALGDRDLVRHLEAADEDVDLTLVLVVEEQQPLGPVESVEGHVRLVARAAEQPLGGPEEPFAVTKSTSA